MGFSPNVEAMATFSAVISTAIVVIIVVLMDLGTYSLAAFCANYSFALVGF